jgi:hypothetical protein
MIRLLDFPKNKDKVLRLTTFLAEILSICRALDIVPILDGSLAVFAYTNNQDMEVNDIDLSCSEREFPALMAILDQKGIGHQLRDWHVLQIIRGDLKIEMGSREYWLENLAIELETIQIDGNDVQVLGLSSLREYYKRGMEDRANKPNENDRVKYERLKTKYEMLRDLSASPPAPLSASP